MLPCGYVMSINKSWYSKPYLCINCDQKTVVVLQTYKFAISKVCTLLMSNRKSNYANVTTLIGAGW